jgi:hypothetical protein
VKLGMYLSGLYLIAYRIYIATISCQLFHRFLAHPTMASNTTPSSAAHPSLDPDLADLQSLLRAALAQGTVPPEKEIETRAELASLLIREYERGAQRNPQHLRDAIEHSEAVLRRLPRDSLERPSTSPGSLTCACRSMRHRDRAAPSTKQCGADG